MYVRSLMQCTDTLETAYLSPFCVSGGSFVTCFFFNHVKLGRCIGPSYLITGQRENKLHREGLKVNRYPNTTVTVASGKCYIKSVSKKKKA